MKKALFTIAAVAAVFCCSCTKDLEDRVGNLEDRVKALEQAVNANVSSIEQLLKASKEAVTITKVDVEADGYTIHFSDGKIAKISNGKDGENGKDAVAPTIGIKEVDGVFCWTVNGELIKNGDANVPVSGKDGVDGKTPQFKIDNGKWVVSFDGKTWTDVPVEPKEISVKLEETPEEYVVVIDDVKIHLKKESAFAIKVSCDEKPGFAGTKVAFKYTVTGADETTKIYVDSKGYEYELDKENCVLYVSVPKPEDKAEYIVLKAVRNSDGKSSAQYITIVLESRYGTFGGVIIKDGNEYKEW